MGRDDVEGQTAADLRKTDETLDKRAKAADRESRISINTMFQSVDRWGWFDDDHETPEPTPLLTDDGDMWLPRNKVGMVAAPGGTGKTWALLQLAIAVATGRKWLGRYEVQSPGHVVCALAETDPADFDRMLNTAAQDLGLDAGDRERIKERLFALPLDGRPVALMDDPTRRLRLLERRHNGAHVPENFDDLYYTDARDELEDLLTRHAPDDGYRLVILDPASRFIGPDVEQDNAAATRFVELLERWKNDPAFSDRGQVGPTVLVSHHVNKRSSDAPIEMLYRQGAARGSSALTDGVRWQLNMNSGHAKESNGELTEYVVMRAAKSNHARKGGITHLHRPHDSGVLKPTTPPQNGLLAPHDVASQHGSNEDDNGQSSSSDNGLF